MPDAGQLLACAAANSPDKYFSQTAQFVTRNARGESRDLQLRLLGVREQASLNLNLRVNQPPAMAGTSILIKEQEGGDDIRLFLPGSGRVQMLTGDMAASKLLGTDFSYLDIKQMYGAFKAGEASMSEPQEVAGRKTHQLVIKPAGLEMANYDVVHAFFDEATCVPLRVEFRTSEGEVVRKLEADVSSLSSLENKHFATIYTLFDLQAETQTRVEFSKMTFDEKISSGAFGFRTFKDFK